MYGIDVSRWQGNINWPMVAVTKKFAIIKSSEGTSWRDPNYTKNRNEAKATGMYVGAYHYFRPGFDPAKQAQHFYNTVGALGTDDIIPWVDVEDASSGIDMPKLPYTQVSSDLGAMLPILDNLFGCKVGIYTGIWFWNNLTIDVGDRPLWVAYWYSDQKPGNPGLPNGWTDYDIHQYTSRGTVPGIIGNVDLNWAPKIEDILYKLSEPEKIDISQEIGTIRRALDSIESKL